MRYILSNLADCRRMAAAPLRAARIRVGADPDVSPDGKPYGTLYSGHLIEGLAGDEQDDELGGSPPQKTGRCLWIPERDSDVLPEDAAKEVAERDLDLRGEFRRAKVEVRG